MTTKIFILFASAFLIISCGGKEENTEKATESASKVKIDSINRDNQIVGVGRIVPEKQIIQLASETSGILKSIYKDENQNVSAGEIIGEVSNQVEAAELQTAKSRITNQNEQTKASNAAIAEYSSKLYLSEINLKRAKDLFNKGAETQHQQFDCLGLYYQFLLL